MSDTLMPGLLHRIRYTPMRDLLRGRLTGRLDLDARIDAADLPAPAKAMLKRVVRRTRLWPLEKIDVADELIAHCADALESGTTVQHLIDSFGDERRAAKLIRRAKRRNRPLAWHLLRAAGWLMAAAVVFYLGLAVCFFWGHPTPNVNYVALLNRSIEPTPAQDRAWPLYREAILALELPTKTRDAEFGAMLDARPGSKRWPKLAQWIEQQNRSVELIHQAAAKPVLGFILGPGGSAYDRALWPNRESPADTTAAGGEPLLSVMLPDLNLFRSLSKILLADAALAGQNGNSQRLLTDIDAAMSLARQTRGHDSLVADLVSLGIRNAVLDMIDRVLTNSPKLLSDTDWQSLAHRLSEPRFAADLINVQSERMLFGDVVQRIYTDDGAGDGRITRRGLDYLSSLAPLGGVGWSQGRGVVALGPAFLLLMDSRREALAEFNRLMDQSEANLRLPLRQANWAPFEQELIGWRASPVESMRHAPLALFMPSYRNAHAAAERYLGRRDGIFVGIALEFHRRQHGNYPQTLDQLTPTLLPAVPADRITGQPLSYRLVDGRPVVYSLGADRDDDGGRAPPSSRPGWPPGPRDAAQWTASKDRIPDGDWVLYPEPPRAESGDD